MITVRIGGNEFPLDDVLDDPGRYARHLERAKKIQGFAECGCGTQRPRPKLVIRRHRDIFLLARWPEQAHQHAAACPFNRQTLAKSGPTDNLDAFRLKDGHHDIRLGVALSVSTRTPAATVQRSAQGQSSKPQRRSAGLLAFLEYAWEQAGLNVWPGTGYRGWTACWSQLTAELAGCRINGTSADGLLHIVQRWDPSRKAEILAEFDAWQARLTPTAAGNPRGIVIGQLESHEPSQYGGKLVLRQSRQRYFLNADLYARLQSSFGSALSAVGRDDQRCVAILLVEMSKGGYLRVADVAAMLTNSHFVPCDSSHEIAMADYLIAGRRAFRKPLRHIGRAAAHPDFILTDVAPEVVIEVLGMSGNADYDARIAEKRAHYLASGIPLLEWDVKAGPAASVRLPTANRSNDGA
ncbi:MAG: DUF1173 domain-containing protein [Cupriavidus sp.]|uniref:DUF1173 family protein n=2 Tax=Burkholderiaceae TaxID=119060 RepID=UPI0004B354F2|nr:MULTISPECIES: DUF1173 family protein [Cupriavidus]MBU66287.1 DUF1173 domain-containing protein [Cupriavidus sp.]MBU66951.1 DUF1173 domain-containing protein [Cupriavidus sp.]MCA3187679.1 DUF1173 family protein [Cupriavidus sp.]MCA3193909.1 DUF1173 family protein [Cupriavidus sp.]MCA3198338.1 DUF1173 family protein [Cupriavidus sp.]